MNQIDEETSLRISMLRYLMIFGIVVLHALPFIALAEAGSGLGNFVMAMFQHAVFRASVPVLTVISGYLLFQSRLDLRFNELLAKKTRSILIPLILFNVPVAIVMCVAQANQLADLQSQSTLYPFNIANWINALTGLFAAPANYPLNFLRDLYFLSLMAPLLGFFLRRYPWHGLALVFLIFWFDLDGQLIFRNSMPIVFYLGGMAAVLEWDLRKLDRFALPLLALFVAICIATVAFQIENRNYLRIVAPILIWPASALLLNTRLGIGLDNLSQYSFLTFLAHWPLLPVAWLIYHKLMPGAPYWIFWTATPFLIAGVMIPVQTYAWRYLPKIANVLLGGRL